jgi:hypothetical protein
VIYLSTNKVVQRALEVKFTFRSIDHKAATTSTRASRKRVTVISPPLSEPGKYCCTRQSGSCRANAPYDLHTRTATAVDEEKRRSEGSNMQISKRRRTKTGSWRTHRRQTPTRSWRTHRRQTPTESHEIRQRHTSTRPLMTLEASPRLWLGGKNLIPSSRSRRLLAFLSIAQTLTKLRKASKNRALPPARAGIHRASMVQGP